MADYDLNIVLDNTDEILAKVSSRVEAALEGCGITAESYATQNIEAAGRVDTGNLKRSITHTVQDDTCYVGTNVEYAIYNEFGTGIHAEGGDGRKTPWSFKDKDGDWHKTSGMKPIHFLKNAIQDHKEKYVEIIKNELKK